MKSFLVFVLEFLYSLKYFPQRFLEIIGNFFPENAFGCKVRGLLLKSFLKKCGKNFQIGLHVKLEHLKNIEVGDDVYIGHGSWISGLRGGIKFEDQVMLGPFVKMVSSNHTFEKGSARFAKGEGKQIFVGFGTWIASGVILTSGVNIGKSCLIAAGAVVTKDIPPFSKVAGVPAKVIGEINKE